MAYPMAVQSLNNLNNAVSLQWGKMMSISEKPFYLKPPWIILFEPHKLQKIRPWNVNISFLLRTFLDEMNKNNEVDFRASGVALDSSATIYLLKSKLLLKLEEPPAPSKQKPDYMPPPLFHPLRYELTSTTIKHLLTALEATLKDERSPSNANKLSLEPLTTHPAEILPQIDLYLIEIEENMKELRNLLARFANKGGLILFSKVIAGLEKIEAIKKFVTLLFLAQKGEVVLWQDEELYEIYITLADETFILSGGAELA